LRSPAIAEKAARTVLSGITMHHADNEYCKRGNFGGLLVRNMVLIYSPDGTNVCGSRWGV